MSSKKDQGSSETGAKRSGCWTAICPITVPQYLASSPHGSDVALFNVDSDALIGPHDLYLAASEVLRRVVGGANRLVLEAGPSHAWLRETCGWLSELEPSLGGRPRYEGAALGLTVLKAQFRRGPECRRLHQGFSYGPLQWAPNAYSLYTIYRIGAHRTDPARAKRAHNKSPQEKPWSYTRTSLELLFRPSIGVPTALFLATPLRFRYR